MNQGMGENIYELSDQVFLLSPPPTYQCSVAAAPFRELFQLSLMTRRMAQLGQTIGPSALE